mgnify:CR=1 FL=1
MSSKRQKISSSKLTASANILKSATELLVPELWNGVLDWLDVPSLAHASIAFSGTRNEGPPVRSFIRKRLVECASDAAFGPNQAQLKEFVNTSLLDCVSFEEQQLLSQPNATTLLALLKETLNCCVMLQYLQLVKSSVQATGNGRVVWPLAAGLMPTLTNENGSEDIIATRMLFSSPLPWNPAAMAKIEDWVRVGGLSKAFLLDSTFPVEAANNYIGMVTCIDEDEARRQHMQCIDRAVGNDGWLDSMCLPDGSKLHYMTRAAFESSGNEEDGGWHRHCRGREYEWLLTEEKVNDKNFLIFWGESEFQFRLEGPWEQNQAIRMIKKLVPCLSRLQVPFHK